MEWYQQLVNKISTFGYEMVRMRTTEENRILFVGPRKLDGLDEKEIVDMLPDEDRDKAVFVEGIKQSTNQAVVQLLQQSGHVTGVIPYAEERRLTLQVIATGDIPKYVWQEVSRLFKKDGFLTGWCIQVNDRVVLNHPLLEDELATAKQVDCSAPLKKFKDNVEHIQKGAEVAAEERKNCDRTHPPSLDEINKLRALLDQCEDVDLLSKIL